MNQSTAYLEDKLAEADLSSEARSTSADLVRSAVVKLSRKGLIRTANAPTELDKNEGDKATELLSVKSRWTDITPAKAKAWLENNFRNRPIAQDVIDAYARDMIAGVWIPTHQGIAFNNRDELIDGQHRLHAIIKSGKTVRMMVTYNLPAQIEGKEMTTMDAVDRGRTRTVADQLKIQHGMKEAPLIAAISQSLGALCFGERTRRISVGQTLEIYREWNEEITWLIEHRTKIHGLKMKGVTAAFAFAMTALKGKSDALIRKMYFDMIKGTDLSPGSPLQQLRDFLVGPLGVLLNRGTDRAVSELVLHALYLELNDKRVPQLVHDTTSAKRFADLQAERVERILNLFKLPQ